MTALKYLLKTTFFFFLLTLLFTTPVNSAKTFSKASAKSEMLSQIDSSLTGEEKSAAMFDLLRS